MRLRYKKYKYFTENVVLLILMNSGNLFAYIFQIYIGKTLNPDDYGLYNALNSFVIIANAPILILPLLLSTKISEMKVADTNLLSRLTSVLIKYSVVATSIIFIAGIYFSKTFYSYFHFHSYIILLMIIVQTSLSIFLPIPLGILQGTNRYYAFGISNIMFPGGRLIFVVLLFVIFGASLDMAILSGLMGICIATIIGLIYIRKYIAKIKLKDKIENIHSYFSKGIPIATNMALVIILGNIDIVVVRHYCSEFDSGLYSSAAIIGRIGFLFSYMLVNILYPETIKNKKGNFKPFLQTSVLTIGTGGTFALICNIFPNLVLHTVFGENYAQDPYILRANVCAMVLLSLINNLLTYQLANGRILYLLIPIAGLCFYLSAAMKYHENIKQLSTVLLSTNCFMILICFVVYLSSLSLNHLLALREKQCVR